MAPEVASEDSTASALCEERDPWMRLVFLLLDAFTQNAVQISPADREAFCRRVKETTDGLTENSTPTKILIAAGSVTQAVENYNRQTQQQVDRRLELLRGTVDQLLAHVASTHAGAPQLALLRSDWDNLTERSWTSFEEKLSAYLATLEAGRNAPPDQFRTAPNPVPKSEHPDAHSDPTTGLPMQAEGEIAIRRKMASTMATTADHLYLAVFYLHRISLTATRFGDSISDQVIMHCSQHIATRLTHTSDVLYRWAGPVFVAMLERRDSESTVAAEIQRLVGLPLSRFFETPARSVYLPIKISGECISASGRSWEDVSGQLERFIFKAAQTLE